jgi:hypothetical protein
MKHLLTLMALGVALLFTVPASHGAPQGKPRTATVSGTVLGPDDKPVANAVVTCQSGGGHTPRAVHSDAHGHFVITKLRRDNYDLRAASQGVFSLWEKNVMVRSGEQKKIILRLTELKPALAQLPQ